MTNQEFSNEFDILYNNIMSNQAPGLDEYEKSVFLTNSQEKVLIGLYNGSILGNSFENTEETRRYLESVIKTYSTSNKIEGQEGLTKDSVFYNLPDDLWFITYESASLIDTRLGCLNNTVASVIPVTQDDFYNIYNNPFRGASDKRVLRLDVKDNRVELVSRYNIDKYLVRYIAKPNPIILEDLPDNLSINALNKKTECELNPILHRVILNTAVDMAKQSMHSSMGN